VTRDGHRAREGRVDLMFALNVETYARDLQELASGGYLVYDSTWRGRRCSSATMSPSSACRWRNCATRTSRACAPAS